MPIFQQINAPISAANIGTSTTTEHALVANFTASGAFNLVNVESWSHSDGTNGCSAARCFTPGTSNETGAVGVGGTFNGNLYHCMYLECSDENNSGSGLEGIRLIQRSTLTGSKAYASAKRFEISNASGGPMSFYNSTGATALIVITDGFFKVGTTTGTGQIQVCADTGFTTGGLRFLNPSGTPDAMLTQASDNNVFLLMSGGAGGNQFNVIRASDFASVLKIDNNGLLTITNVSGTTTNNNAASGSVGETISSLVASGSPISLSTGTGANVTSISLTAGDWDVSGNINYIQTGATATAIIGGISSTSATVPTDGTEVYNGGLGAAISDTTGTTLNPKRFSLSGTTIVYLIAKATFSLGTITAFGSIQARRRR